MPRGRFRFGVAGGSMVQFVDFCVLNLDESVDEINSAFYSL